MSDVLITPASKKIEFFDASSNIDGKIELDASDNLVITNAGGDIIVGDSTSDIFVGDGVTSVDIVFEQSGEIRGTGSQTITLGTSGDTVAIGSGVTFTLPSTTLITNLNADLLDGIDSTSFLRSDADDTYTGTLTIGSTSGDAKIAFPDISTSVVPDVPTNQQYDYMTFGVNGSISQVSGRGALMIASSDDSLVLANGDVGRNFTNSEINVGAEETYLLSDGGVQIFTGLQSAGGSGWPTAHSFAFNNSGQLDINVATGTAPLSVSSTTVVTNLNADLLDGYQPDVSSASGTADTIVLRNANGDDFRRYGFANYFNMSHSTGTRSSDTIFFSSTDDYIRKTNATGMRASLDVPTRTGGDASGTWNISISGSAGSTATADQWTTTRTINMTGDVSSDAVNIDGSGNITITNTAVTNDSHTHDTRYYTESEIDTKLTNGTVTKLANQWSNVTGNLTGYMNDGGGNLGFRFNATTGATNTLVEAGQAYEIEVANDTNGGDFVIYRGTTAGGLAGETITWSEAFAIEGTDGSVRLSGTLCTPGVAIKNSAGTTQVTLWSNA